MTGMRTLLSIDCPDNDVIRVGNVWYMVSTTMHFMPGCEIMKSNDLCRWEHAAYVYDRLDGTPGQRMGGKSNIYGKGMWAASLRYHKGCYYICFVANDTGKTYLFRSERIEGPWKKNCIDGFYHDCSLLFDDDGRTYIAYGNRDIYITELNDELTGPKENGFSRLAVSDSADTPLGYEGTHFYKINGTYYLFFIHSLKDRWFRTESCFMSDSLDGIFTGGDIFCNDNGYFGSGIAQGAITDTPDGSWYAILFQDRGASGRIPYLLPMHFEGKTPVIEAADDILTGKVDGNYGFGTGSDDFRTVYGCDSCFGFKNIWQFNHEPDVSLIERNTEAGFYSVTTGKTCTSPVQAVNTLTQRMSEPGCRATVTVDGTGLGHGDYAGILVLQYIYAFIGITPSKEGYDIVLMSKNSENGCEEITTVASVSSGKVRFSVKADFSGDVSEAEFSYDCGDGFKTVPEKKKMYFRLEHFTGNRFGLTVFSTEKPGGRAGFSSFVYEIDR